MKAQNTRDRLLDAAQKLFVERGIDATSLRSITKEAEANLASVNYHFGSKDELIIAVFASHLEPLNTERIRLLDALEKQSGENALPLEAILEAFLTPAFEMMKNQKPREFVCLLGRLFTESNELRMAIMHQFQEVQQRFFAAIHRTLPDLPFEDLTWRAHFMIGAMAHTFAVPEKLSIPSSNEMYNTSDTNIMHHLITFAAAGLRAPVSSNGNGANKQ
jgi:AcrR family transcriptional regulator